MSPALAGRLLPLDHKGIVFGNLAEDHGRLLLDGRSGAVSLVQRTENRLLRSWAPENESFLISFLEVSSMSQTWMRGKNPGKSLVPDIPVGFIFQDPEQLPVVLERKKS